MHFLCKMRRKRRHQQIQHLRCIHQQRHIFFRHRIYIAIHGVYQFHQTGNGGVKVHAFQIVRHLLNGVGQYKTHFLLVFAVFTPQRFLSKGSVVFSGALLFLRHALHQPIHTIQKACHGLDAFIVPGAAFDVVKPEFQIHSEHIRTVYFDIIIRRNHVAAGFAHLFSVRTQDQPLVYQALERFVKIYQPHIAQRLGEKTCVQ